MYNTVKAIHVALDNKIQQVNSNRKQAFYPEEYDMAINEAVREDISARISAKLNPKGEGAEQSKARYDELRPLKREIIPRVYWETLGADRSRSYIYLPSDYKRIISSRSRVQYTKHRDAWDMEDESLQTWIRLYEVTDSIVMGTSQITFTIAGTTLDISRFREGVKSSDAKFYFINRVLDFFRRYNIDVFYQNFDNHYYPNCIIITNLTRNYNISSSGWDSSANLRENVFVRHIKSGVPSILRFSDNDLVSSEDIWSILNNYHANKNRHLNPISEIVNNRLYVYNSSDFHARQIRLTYYKEPTMCDYALNVLPDVPVTDAIVDRAARIIMGNIKDSFGFQASSQKTLLNS